MRGKEIMDIIQKLRDELKVEKWQAEAAVKLIDEGNTIPFISRYRKEATGSLNDEQLRNLYERLVYLRNLEDKKNQVLGSIEEQGMLTDELREKILAAETLVVVDDLYRPYRPKRKTRASVAKEKGLEGLAEFMPIVALVGRYPANKLIGRIPIRHRRKTTLILIGSPQRTISGINPPFSGLCPSDRQVGYALLTRAPVAIRDCKQPQCCPATCMC